MISYGRGPLGRIYERLRKASWRAQRDPRIIPEHKKNECPLCDLYRLGGGTKTQPEHVAYVAGVRDALNLVNG